MITAEGPGSNGRDINSGKYLPVFPRRWCGDSFVSYDVFRVMIMLYTSPPRTMDLSSLLPSLLPIKGLFLWDLLEQKTRDLSRQMDWTDLSWSDDRDCLIKSFLIRGQLPPTLLLSRSPAGPVHHQKSRYLQQEKNGDNCWIVPRIMNIKFCDSGLIQRISM